MDCTAAQIVEAAAKFRNIRSGKIFLSRVPEDKRAAATKKYGEGMGANEIVIALQDDTPLGSAKSGFFFTDVALYYQTVTFRENQGASR